MEQRLKTKSLYQLAVELENENMNPSVESYGGSNVFLRYKKNKWFENINMIQLKRMKEEQDGEILTELLDVGNKLKREKLREKKKEEALKQRALEEQKNQAEREAREQRLKELNALKNKSVYASIPAVEEPKSVQIDTNADYQNQPVNIELDNQTNTSAERSGPFIMKGILKNTGRTAERSPIVSNKIVVKDPAYSTQTGPFTTSRDKQTLPSERDSTNDYLSAVQKKTEV